MRQQAPALQRGGGIVETVNGAPLCSGELLQAAECIAEAGDRFGDDLCDRFHLVDAADDLAAEGDGRFHVAAEVEVHRAQGAALGLHGGPDDFKFVVHHALTSISIGQPE